MSEKEVRLIDANAVLLKIDKGFDETDPSGEEQIGFLKCRKIVREASTIDPKSLRSQWISVKDGLPEHYVPVIVCRKNGKIEQGSKNVGDWWNVYGTRTKNVTHWMPFPEPPKED